MKNLWDEYGIGEVVGELLTWGHGSGEELYDWLDMRIGKAATEEVMRLLRIAEETPDDELEYNKP